MKIVCSESTENIYNGKVSLIRPNKCYSALSDEFGDDSAFCHDVEVAKCAQDVADLANFYAQDHSTEWEVLADNPEMTWLIREADDLKNVKHLKVYKIGSCQYR